MKKPFKLNAYYLVNMDKVGQCEPLDELGIKPQGKAVIFLDKKTYQLIGERVHSNDTAECLFTGDERKYCKRCDNSFVAGVTYIDSNGEEYLCRKDDSGLVLVDVEHGHMFFCDDYSPKEFTPKVGMID